MKNTITKFICSVLGLIIIAASTSCQKETLPFDRSSFDAASINASEEEANISGVTKTYTAITVFQLINTWE